ncbi:MAG: hypothetical protein KKB81_06585 [Candidatus Margulisbacteria bacterium]|nr:hypothetical protein [Candidatus Margulisiibacteriota bacterium]MBU1022463.1 hypothetical protein [Candidatus Margulisiibacteriota bacterium]MBU1728447.1 hypothetical protein [Candidatus Margulisiibacteriota bacterium]MBU1954594.1 hypothetical protein [Candidatus Margulisiibacteriota bacterium]
MAKLGKTRNVNTWHYPAVGSRADRARRAWQQGRRGVNRALSWVDSKLFGGGRGVNVGPRECLASGVAERARLEITVPMEMASNGSSSGGIIAYGKVNEVASMLEKFRGEVEDYLLTYYSEPSREHEFEYAEELLGDVIGLVSIYFSREGASILAHNLNVAGTLIKNNFGVEVIALALLQGMEAEQVEEMLGIPLARTVTEAAALESFHYHPEMDRINNATGQRPTEQRDRVIMARVREAPQMESHIIQAVSCLEALKVSARGLEASYRRREDVLDQLAEMRALAIQARYLHAELMGQLGYGALASQLYNLGVMHLDFEAYRHFENNLRTWTGMSTRQSLHEINKFMESFRSALFGDATEIRDRPAPEFIWRPKEVARAMEKYDRAYAEAELTGVPDLSAVAKESLSDLWACRIIGETDQECYEIMEIAINYLTRRGWELVPEAEEITDFIEHAKDNGYQSLHLHFRKKGEEWLGQTLMVQIRTREMDLVAEMGTASHWANYKAGLAEEEAADFTGKLTRVGATIEATRAMRWNNIVELSSRNSYVYAINSRGNSPANGAQDSRWAYLDRAGWNRVSVVVVPTGGWKDLPNTLDVSVAMAASNELTDMHKVYHLDEKGMQFRTNGDVAIIANGGIAYVDHGSRIGATVASRNKVNLPSSQARINAALILERGPGFSCGPFPSSPGAVLAGRKLLEDSIDAMLSGKNFMLEDLAKGKPIKETWVFDIDWVARLSGFGSGETLGALMHMFRDDLRAQKHILETFYRVLKRNLFYCCQYGNRGSDEFYVLPSEDRPGVLNDLYHHFLSRRVFPDEIYVYDNPADYNLAVSGGVKPMRFVFSSGVMSMDKLQGIGSLYGNLPPVSIVAPSQRGPVYRFTVSFNDQYRAVLPAIFGRLAHENVTIVKMSAPSRKRGFGMAVVFDVQYMGGRKFLERKFYRGLAADIEKDLVGIDPDADASVPRPKSKN